MKGKLLVVLLGLVFCLCTLSTLAIGDEEKANFDQLEDNIHKVMKKAQIPGLSISVIKDDSVIFSKGFGVCIAGK
ncbi:MAG: hypothetical protein PVI66_10295 [Candidatus Aminicenantes bacterium]|jgi:hypothetical protein